MNTVINISSLSCQAIKHSMAHIRPCGPANETGRWCPLAASTNVGSEYWFAVWLLGEVDCIWQSWLLSMEAHAEINWFVWKVLQNSYSQTLGISTQKEA